MSGIDFASLEYFDWSAADTRRSDRGGERRWIADGKIGDRLYTVIFTIRDKKRRIITMYPAKKKTQDAYNKKRGSRLEE